MNPQKRADLFARLQRANPHPTTELCYRSPYELLVAVVLSAQATDKRVNLVTRNLFAIANTPAAMVKLGETQLKRYIKSIGLYNTKARNIVEAARMLIERFGGRVPHDRAALEALPGVGRKTASVILNTAFGEPAIAVDTHIFRVANRTGLAPGKTVRQVEDGLMQSTPAVYRQDAHHWLILHGRYVCKARAPDCPACIVRDLCEFPHKARALSHNQKRGASPRRGRAR